MTANTPHDELLFVFELYLTYKHYASQILIGKQGPPFFQKQARVRRLLIVRSIKIDEQFQLIPWRFSRLIVYL